MKKVEFIAIDDIKVGDRSRALDRAWANALAAVFKETEMLHPITIWKSVDGPELVAGAHRLEAHVINGETHIAAHWSDASSIIEAKTLEILENIGRNELTALDRANHLSDLKQIYEKEHPETKAGVAGGKATRSTKGIIPFVDDAAAKLGLSDSAIKKSVALWKGLSVASRATARGTWLADHQAGLMQLSKVSAAQQKKALALIFPPEGKQPQATNVADALFILDHGRALTTVERRFAGLNKSLKSLSDPELDAVLTANEERIAQWYERRLGGDT